jgi:propionyl-CoA carboxylase alpha chain
VRLGGWAIEARVYAEDPKRNFLPSIGRLTRYRPPAHDPAVRIDTGVAEGGEISMYYDPMIAKLITAGPDRATATKAMLRALDAFQIRGVAHNIPFLAALMAHPRFAEGRLTTNFIAEEFPDGFRSRVLDADGMRALVAVAAAMQARREDQARTISGQLPGQGRRPRTDWVVRIERANHPVTVTATDGGADVAVDGRTIAVRSGWAPGDTLWTGTVGGEAVAVQVDPVGIGCRLIHGGTVIEAAVLEPRAAALADLMPVKVPPDLSRFLLSPMPGLLVSVAVKPGDEVKAGQELAVVEAMKMENILRADADAVVARVHAAAGDSLAVDQPIVEFA